MSDSDWQPTACILCECNCGIEVRLGGDDGRRFERIRGDKAHPASQGYTCEKALRLDHYQNGRHRLTSPLRRRADGTYEEIDWDTAIAEVAERFAAVRDTHGGESIFYYGGGGQGNHLGGAYATATRAALGSRFRSNALAQEKTGEFWVNAKMLGTSRPRRLRARRGRRVRRQEPVAVPQHPARPHDAEGDRPRPGPLADRRRPPPHRDRRARRLPPPGAARHRRLVPRRALRRARRRRTSLATDWLAEHAIGLDEVVAHLGADRRRPASPASPASTRSSLRAAARRIAVGVERRRLRGPRRADVAALDACQLPREADLAAHRQLRHPRWAVHARRASSTSPARP